MLTERRRQEVLRLVRRNGGVTISEASRKLGVSEQTIRRDLELLASEGLVTRVHGGAVATAGIKFDERLEANPRGKEAAAKKLKRCLPSSGTVYFDGSTTVLNLIKVLSSSRRIEVTTSNVETFRRLSSVPRVTPILTGGLLDSRTGNLIGPVARRSLEALSFDAAFFSCYGISAEMGPMDVTHEDAEIKQIAADRSANTYVVVDYTKLGRSAPGCWNISGGVLATDLSPKDKRLKGMKKWFGKVL